MTPRKDPEMVMTPYGMRQAPSASNAAQPSETAQAGAQVGHTPGKWFVDEDEAEFTVSSDHGQIICRALMADDFPCLEEGTEDHMNDEALANARLIAAAPEMAAELARLRAERAEMLAAATAVLAGLNARIDKASRAGMPVPVFDGIAELHAIIAKAGEQT